MEFEKLVKKMLVEDPFYGFMLTTLERRFGTEVPTLGVHFNANMNAELVINKEFYESLTDEQQMAVFKHELLHLAFHHLTMRDSFPDKDAFNKAADTEVNSYLTGLPEPHCDCSQLNLPPRMGTVVYYRAIQQMKQQQQQQQNSPGSNPPPCNGGLGGTMSQQDPSSGQGQEQTQPQQFQLQPDPQGTQSSQSTGQNQMQPQQQGQQQSGTQTVDDHSIWNCLSDETTKELMDALTDDIIIRTAQSVKTCGSIPAEFKEIVDKLEKPKPRVYDWKRAFRRFLGNSYSESKRSSRRKESRRFPGSAGSKHLKRARVLVAIDTSGSVSQQELKEFASELTYMHKAGSQIHVLECDAAIVDEYDYKPGCLDSVKGRGGTTFGPVIEYYRKRYRMYDTLVYFTDGYASLNLRIPQNNILWVISSNGCKQEYPGKVIYIPQTQNQ